MSELSLWQALQAGTLPPGRYALAEIPDIAGVVSDATLKIFTLSTGKFLNRETLLQSLALSLGFPDYFGNNWDAAYDCLTDRNWPTGSRMVLILDLRGMSSIDDHALLQFDSLIDDSVCYWETRKVALYALVIKQ